MPRKNTAKELQDEGGTISSPLRRSTRILSGNGTSSAGVTTRRMSQTSETADPPARVTRARRTSTASTQSNEDSSESKTNKTNQENSRKETTVPAKRGRKPSVTSEPTDKDESKEQSKPVRSRRNSKANSEDNVEEKILKTAPIRGRRGSANIEPETKAATRRKSSTIENLLTEEATTPTRRTRANNAPDDDDVEVFEETRPVERRRRSVSQVEEKEEVTKPAARRGRRPSTEAVAVRTPGRITRRSSMNRETETLVTNTENEKANKTPVISKEISIKVTPLKKRKLVEIVESELDLSIINESSDGISTNKNEVSLSNPEEVSNSGSNELNAERSPTPENSINYSSPSKTSPTPKKRPSTGAENQSPLRKSPRLSEKLSQKDSDEQSPPEQIESVSQKEMSPPKSITPQKESKSRSKTENVRCLDEHILIHQKESDSEPSKQSAKASFISPGSDGSFRFHLPSVSASDSVIHGSVQEDVVNTSKDSSVSNKENEEVDSARNILEKSPICDPIIIVSRVSHGFNPKSLTKESGGSVDINVKSDTRKSENPKNPDASLIINNDPAEQLKVVLSRNSSSPIISAQIRSRKSKSPLLDVNIADSELEDKDQLRITKPSKRSKSRTLSPPRRVSKSKSPNPSTSNISSSNQEKVSYPGSNQLNAERPPENSVNYSSPNKMSPISRKQSSTGAENQTPLRKSPILSEKFSQKESDSQSQLEQVGSITQKQDESELETEDNDLDDQLLANQKESHSESNKQTLQKFLVSLGSDDLSAPVSDSVVHGSIQKDFLNTFKESSGSNKKNEEVNSVGNTLKNSPIGEPIIMSRISNVFKPNQKECSFMEPMDVDLSDSSVGIFNSNAPKAFATCENDATIHTIISQSKLDEDACRPSCTETEGSDNLVIEESEGTVDISVKPNTRYSENPENKDASLIINNDPVKQVKVILSRNSSSPIISDRIRRSRKSKSPIPDVNSTDSELEDEGQLRISKPSKRSKSKSKTPSPLKRISKSKSPSPSTASNTEDVITNKGNFRQVKTTNPEWPKDAIEKVVIENNLTTKLKGRDAPLEESFEKPKGSDEILVLNDQREMSKNATENSALETSTENKNKTEYICNESRFSDISNNGNDLTQPELQHSESTHYGTDSELDDNGQLRIAKPINRSKSKSKTPSPLKRISKSESPSPSISSTAESSANKENLGQFKSMNPDKPENAIQNVVTEHKPVTKFKGRDVPLEENFEKPKGSEEILVLNEQVAVSNPTAGNSVVETGTVNQNKTEYTCNETRFSGISNSASDLTQLELKHSESTHYDFDLPSDDDDSDLSESEKISCGNPMDNRMILSEKMTNQSPKPSLSLNINTHSSNDINASDSSPLKNDSSENKVINNNSTEEIGNDCKIGASKKLLVAEVPDSDKQEKHHKSAQEATEVLKSSKSRPSLDKFAAAKLRQYIKSKAQDVEESSSEDESENEYNGFIDGMAEEGEDTPSEDSNQIIDEGESIGSSDSARGDDSDQDYDPNDSFICEDEESELLSGNEYDLSMEKKDKPKSSRIIDPDTFEDEDIIKLPKKKREEEDPKKKSRIIKMADSSSDEEEAIRDEQVEHSSVIDIDKSRIEESNSIIVIEDSKFEETVAHETSVEIHDKERRQISSPLPIHVNSVVPDAMTSTNDYNSATAESCPNNIVSFEGSEIDGLNNSEKSDSALNTSTQKKQRKSSLTIQENIILDGVQDPMISRRINSLVESFCSTVKKGEISLNLSLEFGESSCAKETDKTDEPVTILSDIKLNLGTPLNLNQDVKESNNSETENLNNSDNDQGEVTDLREILNKNRLKRRLSKSLSEIFEEDKKAKKRKKNRKVKKSSSEEKLYQESKKEKSNLDPSKEENLKKMSSGLMNQLITDVKNRPRRVPKPTKVVSTPSCCWTATKVSNLKPSTSPVTREELMKLHPKDFKNQLLSDPKRVKRTDTKTLLKMKGAYV